MTETFHASDVFWHCLWLCVGSFFAVILLIGAWAQLREPATDMRSVAIAAAIALGLGLWVRSSFLNPERPLRAALTKMKERRTAASADQAIKEFFTRYHPSLEANRDRLSLRCSEAAENLKALMILKSKLRKKPAIREIDAAIVDLKAIESELSATLQRIDAEFEKLYAAHELMQITGESWRPDVLREMRLAGESTLFTVKTANKQIEKLNPERNPTE
jgi:hypothetical protein